MLGRHVVRVGIAVLSLGLGTVGFASTPDPSGHPATTADSQQRTTTGRAVGNRVRRPKKKHQRRYHGMVLVVPSSDLDPLARNLLGRPRNPLRPFHIDVEEVDVQEYARVLGARSGSDSHDWYCHPDEPDGKSHLPDAWEVQRLNPDLPVVGVDFYDAWTHCRARGGRLLTGDEFEVAGHEDSGRRYPWGDAWESERVCCCGDCPQVQLAGSGAEGATPAGVQHLLGNAWEWTTDPALGDTPEGGSSYLVRGGSFQTGVDDEPPTLATWEALPATTRSLDVGFRCSR